MAVDCTGHLTADINFDCVNAPVGGIEQNVTLINKDDIDVANTTTDPNNPLLVTNIQLKAGKTGYKLTGVKQSNGKAWELVKKENAPDKFKHTLSGVIFNPSLENKTQAQNLSKGGKYVVVVEQVWKGAGNKDAFEVLGFNSGLELSTMTNSSKENDNMILFELASVDGFEEPTMPKTYLDGGLETGSYDVTKTTFDNSFSQATVTPTITNVNISTPTAAAATVGTPFSFQLTATNSPTTFSLFSGGPLPAGLSLNNSTGVISGTPTAANAGASYTFIATNAQGTGPQKVLFFKVNA